MNTYPDSEQFHDEAMGESEAWGDHEDQLSINDPHAFFARYHFRRADKLTRSSIIRVQRDAKIQDAAISALAFLKLIPLRGAYDPRRNAYFALAGVVLCVFLMALISVPTLSILAFGQRAGWLGVVAASFGAIAIYMAFIQPWWLQSKLLRTRQE